MKIDIRKKCHLKSYFVDLHEEKSDLGIVGSEAKHGLSVWTRSAL